MYREPAPRLIRPAGESDEDDDSDYNDGFDMPGLSSSRRRNVIRTPTIVNRGGDSNGLANSGGANNTNATNNDDWGDDWGRGTVPSSAPYSTSSYSQPPPAEPEIISQSEASRIACSRGNVDKVKEFLDTNVLEVNCFFKDDFSPLITASAHGHPQLVKLLLERGADPKIFSRGIKTTALMAAVSCTRPDATEEQVLECVQHLVEHDCPVNTQDRSAISALLITIKRRNERRKVAEYLLDHGADPNVQDFSGRTPLFHAAEVGDGRSCRLLLEKNADINLIDDSGWSAFDVASDKGFHNLSELLYKVRNTKWKPGQNPTLMKEIDDNAFRPKEIVAGEGVTIREDSQIEMLLSAINAGKYTDNFRQHRVTYLQFLQFEDEDLQQVGVMEVGIRKKLLESIRDVHNTDWAKSSLKMVPKNKKVTAGETVCIINNIKLHVEHISSTLCSLRKRIAKDPNNLRYGKENSKIKDIIYLLKGLDEHGFSMEKEVLAMSQMFETFKSNAELQLGDCFELKPEDLKAFTSKWEAFKKSDYGTAAINANNNQNQAPVGIKKKKKNKKLFVVVGISSAIIIGVVVGVAFNFYF